MSERLATCPVWCTLGDRPHDDHEWCVTSLPGVLLADNGDSAPAWGQLVVHGRNGAEPMPVVVVVLGRLESVRFELTWQRLGELAIQAESARGRLA